MKVTTSFRDAVAVVSVVGDVDMYTSPDLRSSLSGLSRGKTPRIVVDLSQVGFMDSSGIATLVQSLKEVRPKGGEVRLAGVGRNVLRVLELSNLTSLFPVHSSVEEALGGV